MDDKKDRGKGGCAVMVTNVIFIALSNGISPHLQG